MEDLANSMDFCSINNHHRTIIHIDIDCFYAQVEMIKNPALRDCPLGVQQKNIIVTSNYIAREFGIQKCMLVTEGLQLCPQLVLVKGEDLQDYRQMSSKITTLLQSYSPLVEKLGLDENFIDVTNLVSERIEDLKGVNGFVYGEASEKCECGCKSRLTIGSHIASEMRREINSVLGITCCAGIAHNKLLAKLVCGVHKPNQQTTIFPCSSSELLLSLTSVREIPGIGLRTNEILQSLQISNVLDLRNCNLTSLQKVLGYDIAVRVKKLSYGIDDSPVKQSGKPQSIGLEDGFKKICLESEVKEKFSTLLYRLLKLLGEDGRVPGSIRVTVRKYDNARKYSHRESRQCNVAASVFINKTCDSLKESLSPKSNEKLMGIIMNLFHKIVNISKPFHLTLLGLAFTKFQERKTGKSSIASFLTNDISVQSVLNLRNIADKCERMEVASTSCSPSGSIERSGSESEPEPSPKKTRKFLYFPRCKKRPSEEGDESSPNKKLLEVDSSESLMLQDLSEPESSIENKLEESEMEEDPIISTSKEKQNTDFFECPHRVDKEVFKALPPELKNELLEAWEVEKTKMLSKIPNGAKSKQKSITEYFITK
ncbi:hypothetical protein L9F63_022795 [Diploptera punctata]|uniref:UmuC domain-containing protein n=1 Tax=Diploptera punctata TaxID=6984 RepID=A0AAD8EAF3_DIPPU|nr:hypothetical protein L9F63_022795 [Diploptera punctata]